MLWIWKVSSTTRFGAEDHRTMLSTMNEIAQPPGFNRLRLLKC